MASSCNKVPFETKTAAKQEASRVSLTQRHFSRAKATRAKGKSGRKWHVYECSECGQWHLTSMAPKLWRRLNKSASS